MNSKSNNVLEHCKKFLKSDEFKKEIKELLNPIFEYFFKEMSIYLYFFIFFILSSFILHLGVLILLIRYNKILNNNNLKI